jgi:hypothetical protein
MSTVPDSVFIYESKQGRIPVPFDEQSLKFVLRLDGRKRRGDGRPEVVHHITAPGGHAIVIGRGLFSQGRASA